MISDPADGADGLDTESVAAHPGCDVRSSHTLDVTETFRVLYIKHRRSSIALN